ncbi:MAG TPA: hypothetical protein VGC73_06030, partial [Pyrinomonadaceae bacterium]
MTIPFIDDVPMLTVPRIAAASVLLNAKPKSWLPLARLMPLAPDVATVVMLGLVPPVAGNEGLALGGVKPVI